MSHDDDANRNVPFSIDELVFFFSFLLVQRWGGGGDNICSTGLYGEHNLASRTYRFYDRDLNDKVKASAGRNFKIKIYITRTYNPFD